METTEKRWYYTTVEKRSVWNASVEASSVAEAAALAEKIAEEDVPDYTEFEDTLVQEVKKFVE